MLPGQAPPSESVYTKNILNIAIPTDIKGIVHFEIKIWYLSAYPKGIRARKISKSLVALRAGTLQILVARKLI